MQIRKELQGGCHPKMVRSHVVVFRLCPSGQQTWGNVEGKDDLILKFATINQMTYWNQKKCCIFHVLIDVQQTWMC